jgi:hydrogenase nickel incorporation protein HypA/HybF
MHELSIAQSLLSIVLETAAVHGVEIVRRIVVKVGGFTNVVPDSLRFCFDLIKGGTAAAEAKLDLIPVPIAGRCRECGAELGMAEPVFNCPQCGSISVELTQGRELYIECIETDEPEAEAAGTVLAGSDAPPDN